MATKTGSGRQTRRSSAPKKELTPKQRLFVTEYLVDKNATQAAIRAGYSKKTSNEQGARLLANVSIRAAIDAALEEQIERVEVNADTVLRELLALATVDVAEAFDENGALKPIHDIPVEVRKAISGIDVYSERVSGQGDDAKIGTTKKIRFWDKKGSLELLGKHLKMFTDKFEVAGKDGGPIPHLVEIRVVRPAKKDRN